MPILDEISFQDASPEIQAIYRELMAAAGSGSPALIFRHLATYPGLLEWLWETLRPEVETGWPRQAVWDLVAETPPVQLPPITSEDLADQGVDATAREVIGHMLTSYNRMNPMNMVMIGAARVILDPVDDGGEVDVPEAVPPAPPPPPDLPAPPAVASLTDDNRALIVRLCRSLPDLGAEATPTMYRHFGLWPDFLNGVGGNLLAQMDAIVRATDALGQAARPLMQTLAHRAAEDAAPPPEIDGKEALVARLDGFAGFLIPHMIVVGRAVDASLPD